MSHETVVMIVDDDTQYALMAPPIARELKGVHLIHHTGLQGAMEVIRSDARVDIIFCDWDLTGPGFVHAVRNDPETHHTPLVAMSRSDTNEVIAATVRAGATGHLVKPFLEKALVSTIRRITKNQERRRRRRTRPLERHTFNVTPAGGPPVTMELLDISITACQGRVGRDFGEVGRVYQKADIALSHEGVDMAFGGELIRLAYDPEGPHPEQTIRVAFRFTDIERDREKLTDMLDTMRDQWHPSQ